MTTTKRRKLMIVIEETDDQGNFNVYMSGDKERFGHVPDDQLSAVEYWGRALFSICIGMLKESGVIRTETRAENQTVN
jgi:hypothetical protein